MKNYTLFVAMFFAILKCLGQPVSEGMQTSGKNDTNRKWTFHFQQSMVNQWHERTHFAYQGPSSLDSIAETRLSMTTTMFIGRKLWNNGAIYFSPEVTAGNGLSFTHGIAGFTNGEIYRVGNPNPTPFIARFYYQQSFALVGSEYENREDGINQIAAHVPTSRITINIGKFCLADFFDGNTYNHDARTQFLNWSMMAQGAWDFPADTRGYTSGIEIELVKPKWSLQYAFVQMSKFANALDMDWDLAQSNGQTIEYDRKVSIKNHPGVIRCDVFMNSCTAPKYADAVKQLKAGNDTGLAQVFFSAKMGPAYGGIKYGFGVNIEQEITNNIGMFFRYSWNDGKTASWEFTDIDESVQLGTNLSGKIWNRPTDNIGVAEVINGISKDHQDFLAAGGYTFIIGDGKLNYGREIITEAYYKSKINKFLSISFDYQLVFNPGYNKDRQGPISVPGLRIHVEF